VERYEFKKITPD